MNLSEHVVTLSKDFSLFYEGKVSWEDRVHFMSVWAGVAGQVAKMEARIKALEASASKSVLRRLDAQLNKESDV